MTDRNKVDIEVVVEGLEYRILREKLLEKRRYLCK